MKNPYAWAILLVSVTIVIILGVLTNNSQEFVKTYFDVQTHKMKLRSEKSVDSIMNVITIKNQTIDSLLVENNALQSKLEISDNNIKLLKKNNEWLKSCLAW